MTQPAFTALLPSIIGYLYESEINAGIATFWDAGLRVWIGDESNGRIENQYSVGTGPNDLPTWGDVWSQAASWLWHTAVERYPESLFAKRALGVAP